MARKDYDFSLTAKSRDGKEVKTLHGRIPAGSPTEAQTKALGVGRHEWRQQIMDGSITEFVLNGITEVTP